MLFYSSSKSDLISFTTTAKDLFTWTLAESFTLSKSLQSPANLCLLLN